MTSQLLPKQILATSIATLVLACGPSQAATWNGTSGNWSDATRWTGGVPNAIDAVADASTVNITANQTITLDGNFIAGTLQFGDATTASNTWTLGLPAGNVTNTLTLSTSTGLPQIDVVNQTGTINTLIAGTQGLVKNGAGIAVLNGSLAGLSGPVTVNHGRLTLGVASGLHSGITGLTVNFNNALNGGEGVHLRFIGNQTIPTISLLLDSFTPDAGTTTRRTSLKSQGGAFVYNGAITLKGNSVIQFTPEDAANTMTLNGAISADPAGFTGALLVRGNGTVTTNASLNIPNGSVVKTDAGSWTVNASGNSWVRTQISVGTVNLGVADGLDTDSELQLGQADANSGFLELNGFNQSVGRLFTNGSTTSLLHHIRNSSTTLSTFTVAPPVAETGVYRGSILGNIALVKSGAGTLELGLDRSNLLLETASTTVNDGVLLFNPSGSSRVQGNILGSGGSIEKTGTSVLAISGAYNYGGITTIGAGEMTFGGGSSSGSIAVANDATLGLGYAGERLETGTVTLGSGAGSPLVTVNLNNSPLALLTATTGLSTGGTSTIVNVQSASSSVGTKQLIRYAGGVIGGSGFNFVIGSLPHITASLVNNPGSVDLNITAVDSLVWTGATNANWDVNTTANFKLASNGSAAPFFQSDAVLFDDTANPSNTTINVTGATIGNLTFNNNMLPYIIIGDLAGPGGISINGSAGVGLNGNSTFTGPVIVTSGTLRTDSGGALGSLDGQTIINATGALDVNGQNLGKEVILVSGAGSAAAGVPGAIVNTGADQTNALRRVRLTGNASFGGFGRWDIRSRNEGGDFLDLGGFTLTKVGGNQVSLVGVDISNGNLAIDEGTLSVETTSKLQGTGSVTVGPNGQLGIWGNSDGNVTRPIFLQGGIIAELGSNNLAIVDSPITLLADSTLRANTSNTVYRQDGVISGSFGLIKDGPGVVQLTAANTYTGPTTINLGALRLGDGGTTGTLATSEIINNANTGNATAGGFEIRRSDNFTIPCPVRNQADDTSVGSLVIASGSLTDLSAGVTINGIVRQGTLHVGRLGTTGRLFVESGADIQVRNYFIGEQLGRTGHALHTGGAVLVTDGNFRVGHWPQSDPVTGILNVTLPSTYVMNSGTITTQASFTGNPQIATGTVEQPGVTYIGIDTTGELTINGGILDTKAIVLDNRVATAGVDKLTLNGGLLRVGGVGNGDDSDLANIGSAIISPHAASTGTYAVSYTGGEIEASGNFLQAADASLSNANGGVRFDSNGNVITVTGVFSGSGGFDKDGAGTMLIKSTSTYTGDTDVNAGILLVTGSIAGSTVNVSAGATLGGSGTTGDVNLAANSILAPGSSPGVLNVGDLTFAGGSILSLELNGAAAGTGYDQAGVTGALTLLNNVILTLTLGYDPADFVDSFTVLANDGADAINGPGLFTFNGTPLANGASFSVGGLFPQQFQIAYNGGDGNDVVLQAIPEPASAALVLAGLTMLGWRRKRLPTS